MAIRPEIVLENAGHSICAMVLQLLGVFLFSSCLLFATLVELMSVHHTPLISGSLDLMLYGLSCRRGTPGAS